MILYYCSVITNRSANKPLFQDLQCERTYQLVLEMKRWTEELTPDCLKC